MIRELQVLDRELSKANTVTVLRRDFNLFERNLLVDATPYLKDIEKSAKKEKLPRVTIIATLHD
jgi:hypothetical protein